jgi:N-acetylglucosaminyldiphosphoundecaprenol N-acetyl-beta-D-mannosaminyltransferase
VVLYLRLRGKIIDRQPGIEIAENLLEQAATQGWSVFFYGGKPAVIQQAADNWQQRCPDLAIVGVQHGYLTDSEQPELLQALRDRQPQIILVGLGVPRQEFWIDQHRSCCPNSVWIGVGGSFDIWAGVKSRAPQWLRDHNLEWTYRLYQEPARWRRMMALPQFAWKALFDR